jgi:hypothetical protein
VIGVFHDVHCQHFRSEKEQDLEWFFRGCPAYHRLLADQLALAYLRVDFHGESLHRVTATFWNDGEGLKGAEPWEILTQSGVSLLKQELIEDRDLALANFQMAYGMSDSQVSFVVSLFERKMARPPARIELTATDVHFLQSSFNDPRAEYAQMKPSERENEQKEDQADRHPKWLEKIDSAAEAKKAMDLCRDLFAEMDIIVPQMNRV